MDDLVIFVMRLLVELEFGRCNIFNIFTNLGNFLLLCHRQRLHIDAIILNFSPKLFLLFPHPSLALSLSDGISFQLLYD